MTADLLRRAAAKIRETATAASVGPWSKHEADDGTVSVVSPDVRFLAEIGAAVFPMVHRDAEHIALWSPDIVGNVADLLDTYADIADRAGYPSEPASPALRLARHILGEDA